MGDASIVIADRSTDVSAVAELREILTVATARFLMTCPVFNRPTARDCREPSWPENIRFRIEKAIKRVRPHFLLRR